MPSRGLIEALYTLNSPPVVSFNIVLVETLNPTAPKATVLQALKLSTLKPCGGCERDPKSEAQESPQPTLNPKPKPYKPKKP